MDISQVIIKPYHTEKTYGLRNADKVVITFIVARTATKISVKNAFEAIYGIKPEKINIVNRKSTNIRTGTATPGRSKALKIAYVILPEGVDVALTQEEMEAAQKATKEAEQAQKAESTEVKPAKKSSSKKLQEVKE